MIEIAEPKPLNECLWISDLTWGNYNGVIVVS